MFKVCYCVTSLTLFLVSFLPLATINNQKKQINKLVTRSSKINLSNPKQAMTCRTVHKFKSVHDQTSNLLFQKLKSQLATTNINVLLKTSASFNYSIMYDNYDTFGVEHQGNQETITQQSENFSFNVGIKLLQFTKIRIGTNKWRGLIINDHDTPNPAKINPSSVFYYVSPTGSKSSPTVTINRSYTYRSGDKGTDKIGVFNVNNLNNNINHFFTREIWGGMIIGIVAMLIIVIVAVTTITLLLRRAVKSWYSGISIDIKAVEGGQVAEGRLPQAEVNPITANSHVSVVDGADKVPIKVLTYIGDDSTRTSLFSRMKNSDLWRDTSNKFSSCWASPTVTTYIGDDSTRTSLFSRMKNSDLWRVTYNRFSTCWASPISLDDEILLMRYRDQANARYNSVNRRYTLVDYNSELGFSFDLENPDEKTVACHKIIEDWIDLFKLTPEGMNFNSLQARILLLNKMFP